MNVESSAFKDGHSIPAKYTCAGADVSPALKWSEAPAEAKSLTLICDDPDAPGGNWVHWVMYDLPPTTRELAEHVTTAEVLPNGAKQGMNDFRRIGYGGPCPPPGKPHRYMFRLYALDALLSLPPRASRSEVMRAMEGHVLARGQLMGTYGSR